MQAARRTKEDRETPTLGHPLASPKLGSMACWSWNPGTLASGWSETCSACSPCLLPEAMTGIGARPSPGPAPWWRGPKNLCVTIPDRIVDFSGATAGDTKAMACGRWTFGLAGTHSAPPLATKRPCASLAGLLCSVFCSSSSCVDLSPVVSLHIHLLALYCKWCCCGGGVCQRRPCQRRFSPKSKPKQ